MLQGLFDQLQCIRLQGYVDHKCVQSATSKYILGQGATPKVLQSLVAACSSGFEGGSSRTMMLPGCRSL